MLQKERALIILSGSSWESIQSNFGTDDSDSDDNSDNDSDQDSDSDSNSHSDDDSSSNDDDDNRNDAYENEAGPHTLVLETFTFGTGTGEYILKNSHGPTGGSRGRTDGKVGIPEAVFKELNYSVYFIKEKHSTHASLEENGWMWAVATVSHTKQSNRYPVQESVEEVKEQWYTYLAYFEWREMLKFESGHWSVEQRQDWQRNEWYAVDSKAGYARKRELLVTENFYQSNGLQLSKALSFGSMSRPISTMRKKIEESEASSALILFAPRSWKTIVSKFTKFHSINGGGYDPGEPQLMILQGFVRKEPKKGIYMLQDTHGLNGIHPAEDEQSVIKIPEDELHDMFFTVWFVEYQPLPSPYTFVANGKHLSDLLDVYRVDFIDAETKEKKWFVIDVMYEIEMINRDEMQRDVGLAKSFDVYTGEELQSSRIQLNRRRIKRSNGLKIEWDDTNILVTNIQPLSVDVISALPETDVESVLRKLRLLDCAEILATGGYEELRALQRAESQDLEEIGLTPEQARRIVTYYRPSHRWCALGIPSDSEITNCNFVIGDDLPAID